MHCRDDYIIMICHVRHKQEEENRKIVKQASTGIIYKKIKCLPLLVHIFMYSKRNENDTQSDTIKMLKINGIWKMYLRFSSIFIFSLDFSLSISIQNSTYNDCKLCMLLKRNCIFSVILLYYDMFKTKEDV